MSGIRTFRDLIAWQKGMDLVRSVYRIATAMPEEERAGLTNQMRRAAISIPSNIAEGYARKSTKDYLKFLRTARGSLAELATQYELITTMNLVPENPELNYQLTEVDRVLQGLIRSIEHKLQ